MEKKEDWYAENFPTFVNLDEKLIDLINGFCYGKPGKAARWFYNTNFRKKHISWTRFRQKRLTLKGFLSFDRGARIRTAVYIAIGSLFYIPVYSQSSIRNLVRISCQAVEEASLPRLITSTAKYEESKQVDALRDSIKAKYDRNKDRKIDAWEEKRLQRETGLTISDINIRCNEGNLEKLLAGALRGSIISESLPPAEFAKIIRQRNFQKGMQEYEKAKDELWQEVDKNTEYQWASLEDYKKLETWKRGAGRFWDTGKEFIPQGLQYITHPRNAYCEIGMYVRMLREEKQESKEEKYQYKEKEGRFEEEFNKIKTQIQEREVPIQIQKIKPIPLQPSQIQKVPEIHKEYRKIDLGHPLGHPHPKYKPYNVPYPKYLGHPHPKYKPNSPQKAIENIDEEIFEHKIKIITPEGKIKYKPLKTDPSSPQV